MGYVDGIYAGLEYHAFNVNSSNMSKLDDFIDNYIVARNSWESVVSIFMFPNAFLPTEFAIASGDTTGAQGKVLNTSYTYSPRTHLKTLTRPTKIGNYTPRNKKLLTHPYTFVVVDSLNDSKVYRYEWSRNQKELTFVMCCGFAPNAEIVCYPSSYNGSVNWSSTPSHIAQANPTESVTCEGFPQCAVPIDSYRAWLAQKGGSAVISGIGSIAGAAAGIALASNPVSATVAGVLGAVGLASTITTSVVEATKGNRTRGEQGSSTDVAMKRNGFWFKQMHITPQFAKIIDDFFDRYGYSCCELKTPNINVRRHWCYTKTKNCSIDGNIPADDLKKIKKIFDNGITFWKNGDEVDNYALDNTV